MGNEARQTVVQQRERMIEVLRGYGSTYGEVGRRFAASLGLHHTDASAVIEILAAEERGTPLSPARLRERVGLTAGATSSLLNRLETAGYVIRSHEHADRRIVTLHSTAEIQKVTDDFFDPLGTRIDDVMSKYPDDVLLQLEEFISELRSTMEAYVGEKTDS